jgi:poly-gamma-glutamate capsule biosynthesis protein CapA/YwtB (metallophosphatase superfamily)
MWRQLTGSIVDADLIAVNEKPGARVVFGGDVSLGRRQNAHSASNPSEALEDVPQLKEADLAIVNLESVVANQGEFDVEKGESGPYYFRGRPETLRVLTEQGIDIVQTANNHSGDYGTAALLEQLDLLDQAGIGHAGAGPTRDAACSPTFRRAGDVQVAFFGLDATMPYFSAWADRAGTCFLSLADTQAWQHLLATRIEQARRRAHVVMVGVHWGDNWQEVPSQRKRRVAQALVNAGADAILGTSAHLVQGVQMIDGRPVIHDAGNLLFDFVEDRTMATGVFTFVLSKLGIIQLWFDPLRGRAGRTETAKGAFRAEVLELVAARSRGLGSEATFTKSHRLVWELIPATDRPEPTELLPPNPLRPRAPAAALTPPGDCISVAVPEDARIEPVKHGPLTLLGMRVDPQKITKRDMLFVETWWRVDKPVTDDFWIRSQLVPIDGSENHTWLGDHEPCDWLWPTSRFKPGVIYRDKYGVRPPDNRGLMNGTLMLKTGVLHKRKVVGRLTDGPLVLVERTEY